MMDPITLRLFKTFGPYALVAVIAACAGFSGAWYIQGLRVTAAKQKLVDWEQAAKAQQQQEKDKHQKLNEETASDWIENLNALHECYRTGRCGVRKQPGSMPSGGISAPTGKPDAAGADAVPAPDRVAEDCAETTLNLNMLQGWNEKVSK